MGKDSCLVLHVWIAAADSDTARRGSNGVSYPSGKPIPRAPVEAIAGDNWTRKESQARVRCDMH
jgi:hypothetical protein